MQPLECACLLWENNEKYGSVLRPAVGQIFEVELFQSEEAETSSTYWAAREDW